MPHEFDNFDEFENESVMAQGFDRRDFGRHHSSPRHHHRRPGMQHCRPVCHCGRFGCRCSTRCGGRWFW